MQSWHLMKLAKFQSMFILVIQCTWQEVTENSPNALIKYQITKLELNLHQDTFKPLKEQNIA